MKRKVLLSVGGSVELITLTTRDEAVWITIKFDTLVLSHDVGCPPLDDECVCVNAMNVGSTDQLP
jgi:hypothetical protein